MKYHRSGEILCGQESYAAAHRSREFHRHERAMQHFERRKAFKAAMAELRAYTAPKVVHHVQTRPVGGQLKVLETIRKAAIDRAQADALRREQARIRNLGRPQRA